MSHSLAGLSAAVARLETRLSNACGGDHTIVRVVYTLNGEEPPPWPTDRTDRICSACGAPLQFVTVIHDLWPDVDTSTVDQQRRHPIKQDDRGPMAR